MKKISNYIIILAAILVVSCAKVLDVNPTASIASSVAIQDKAGVEKAIAGSYDALQLAGLYGRNRVILGDLAADNLEWTGTSMDYAQVDNDDVPIDNGIIDGMWSGAYDGINRVNNVLAALPGIGDISDAERSQYEGECFFLRALFHFNLLTYFGGVPIKTEPTLDVNNIDQARNSEAEVYDQVISDLKAAERDLPEVMEQGRANSFSAEALLAKVYLTRFHADNNNDYANLAVEYADKVLTGSGYSLTNPYPAMYSGDNSEVIFQVLFSAQDKNRLAEYFLPRSLAGRYEVGPSDSFIQGFEPADSIRRAASVATDTLGFSYGNKYTELVEGSDAVLVLRLAEIYLIKAEALAYTGGDIPTIQQNIDMIRNRAGLQPTTAATYDELKLAIENERLHEFAFEGYRWFDLVRTKRATTVLGIDEDHTLFPIPLSEMTTNKLMQQNPGY
jgi:starch-binding outer membrane protein, SusD/RagB family